MTNTETQNEIKTSFVLPAYIPKREIKATINRHVKPENVISDEKRVVLKTINNRQAILIEFDKDKYRIYGVGSTLHDAIIECIFHLDFPDELKKKISTHKESKADKTLI